MMIYLCIYIHIYTHINIYHYIYFDLDPRYGLRSSGRWSHCKGFHVLMIYVCMYISIHTSTYTSSTAQGGGGSFNNRKPKGELGCCESGMAERSHWWIERWLISLTLSLSFSDYQPTYLSTYLSISLSDYLFIYLSQLPKVVRSWCILYILTCKCASRHNSVQFFISHLARWLRTRCFSEPTFRTTGATNHRENTVFRDFHTYLFAHLHLLSSASFSSLIFSLLLFSSLWLFPSKTQCFATFIPFRASASSFFCLFLFSDLLSSTLLSDSSHLCFSSVHIAGSLTPKLPSLNNAFIQSIYIYIYIYQIY